MVNPTNGYFTTQTFATVLRSLPETDGTYHDVIRQVSEYASPSPPAPSASGFPTAAPT